MEWSRGFQGSRSPVLLQLIYVELGKIGSKAEIFTLPEAIKNCHYEGSASSTELDLETEAFLAHQNPPNLSLNLSINIRRRRLIARVVAPVGVVLQGGVLLFAGLAQYRPGILKANGPAVYGFPMFLAGTL